MMLMRRLACLPFDTVAPPAGCVYLIFTTPSLCNYHIALYDATAFYCQRFHMLHDAACQRRERARCLSPPKLLTGALDAALYCRCILAQHLCIHSNTKTWRSVDICDIAGINHNALRQRQYFLAWCMRHSGNSTASAAAWKTYIHMQVSAYPTSSCVGAQAQSKVAKTK
jgi:hypothetical protein